MTARGLVLALLAPGWVSGAVFEYKTVADWGTGFTGEISVKNDGPAAVIAWSVEFELPREITSIWDGRIASRTGEKYVIRSAGWNDRIEPGGRVTFGFTGSPGNLTEGPKGLRLIDGAPPPGSRATVLIRETARAEGAFTATILVTNTGKDATRGWRLSFRSGMKVVSSWNGEIRAEGGSIVVTPGEALAPIAPGESVLMGFTGEGALPPDPPAGCDFNGEICGVLVTPLLVSAPAAPAISIEGEPAAAPLNRVRLGSGESVYKLKGGSTFRAVSSNPGVAAATVTGDSLRISAVSPGRAAIRIEDPAAKSARILGVRVDRASGLAPGLPPYVATGTVSDDSPAHLDFWSAIEPGARNKRADLRYLYLNGGPVNGWDTWSYEPGGRASQFIRNSQRLGMMPFFVFYNIPEAAESFETVMAHIQDPAYMAGYFANLRLLLDIIRREAGGDAVGLILEPDFLGYLAQNAGSPASEIPAAVRPAYDTGLLIRGVDPEFPDTVKGFVEAVNHAISRRTPETIFGWQMNLWAAPPGGYHGDTPVKGIVHHEDPAAITREASAIARFYLDAGVGSNGASFFAIDKYGLDAVGLEAQAARDPASSIWFWSGDQWHNYLAFVRAASETLELPAILWQLPVGRINSTRESNPYSASGKFEDLKNSTQSYEDSAPSFFLGDTFAAEGPRFEHFASNRKGDPGLKTKPGEITWAPHMADAARAGVVAILFGAGVGASTNAAGSPPSDGYWWITKTQRYFDSGPPKVSVTLDPNLR